LSGEQAPKYTNKVDIWALGCIIYELASGMKAFGSNNDLRRFAEANDSFPRSRLPFDGDFVEFLFELIKNMLTVMSDVRPRAMKLLELLEDYKAPPNSAYSIENEYDLRDKVWLEYSAKDVYHRATLFKGDCSECHEVRPIRKYAN
jgi:serine/threonine protein kinase